MASYLYNDSEMQSSSELVLCIEEYENKDLGRITENIDMRLFLFYHKDMNEFVIFGRRQDKKESTREFVPFHFVSKNENAVFNFIEFVVDSESKHSITLYNYNNLYSMDESCEPYCYEQLEENMDKDYELAGYDYISLSRRKVMKYLTILKHVE
jgi:hypothetical protein